MNILTTPPVFFCSSLGVFHPATKANDLTLRRMTPLVCMYIVLCPYSRAVHGMDEQFQVCKCPLFLGCIITVSGLSVTERSEAKRLIEKEGEYLGVNAKWF